MRPRMMTRPLWLCRPQHTATSVFICCLVTAALSTQHPSPDTSHPATHHNFPANSRLSARSSGAALRTLQHTSGPLRLRGGAFWFSAVAGPAEKTAFWRQLSSAPAQWIRDRMQKLCPFGAKEASIAAKELVTCGSRLRGGGLRHSMPIEEPLDQTVKADPSPPTPFTQPGDVVVVTGASGYVAGHVIRSLVDRGYKVRGTVRALNDTAKTAHLRASFPEVELWEADLMEEGSFAPCFKGAKFVIHCASPFKYQVEDPETELVEPAVKGTMNILRTARKVGGIRRVIVTSSQAAVLTLAPPADVKRPWTEDDWNVDTTLQDHPYAYSKTLAEQAAWIWMGSAHNSHSYGLAGGYSNPEEIKAVLDAGGQEYRISFDLVTMNPAFIVGPSLSNRTDGESVQLVKGLLEGRYSLNGTKGGRCIGAVDVRDVALAHVRAMENGAAFGRYLLSSSAGISHLEMASHMASDPELQSFPLPTKEAEPTAYRPLYNTAKARRDLGMEFRPVGGAVVAAAKDLIAKHLVSLDQASSSSSGQGAGAGSVHAPTPAMA